MNEFRLGSVIGRGFGVFAKNLVPFTLLSLVVYLPLIFYTVTVVSGEPDLEALSRYGLIGGVGGVILGLIVTAALMYGTFQQLRGTPASIGVCFSRGLARLFPVLGVGILMGLCVAGGFMLLIIPGIIFYCMLWVAVPVAVVEKPGLMASLKRSAELTKGYRWQILGIIIVIAVIQWLAGKVVELVFLGDVATATWGDVRVYMFATLGVSIAIGTLQAVVNAVGYHDLRLAKDGVDMSELESVFD